MPSIEGAKSSRNHESSVSDGTRETREPRVAAAVAMAARASWFEMLERRQLLSATTVQTLPFTLDFSADKGEILDKDGQGTGLTRVQANTAGNQYQPSLIDLDTTAGVLKITTSGAGTSSGTSNNQLNALETQFNGTVANGFSITARINGPFSYLNANYDQGGIYFGPDQDNFVKLAPVFSGGQFLQFKDEIAGAAATLPSAAQLYNIGSFSSINTLDVRLIGNSSTGKVSAYYAINGGAFAKIPYDLTLSGTAKTNFFNATSRAGLIVYTKSTTAPPITVAYDSFDIAQLPPPASGTPTVTQVRPRDGVNAVSRDAFVACDVSLPVSGAGIDAATMAGNVLLFRTSDHALIPGNANTSGGGDAIVFQPSQLLDPNTNYTFQVTSGLEDTAGNSFAPFTSTFTTGTGGGTVDPSLAFDQVALPNAQGQSYTCVTMGPDGKLYASTFDGIIQRFTINADGTLSMPQNITTVQTNNGGPRAVIGMAFDPASTASNLILWISNNQSVLENASDWTGKISKLSGPNLATYQDVITGLPRSIRDHMTNQLAFGPDGKLYFTQAAMNAMGAGDNAWGNRNEHLLSSAVLQLDTSKLGTLPLNVRTEGVATPYDPFAASAPLKIFASGVRNSYDLLWHSNGHLYTMTNGSAAGGNTPASPNPAFSSSRVDQSVFGNYTGPVVPGLSNVQDTEHDWLFDIDRTNVGYYGHPNPARYEWVMDGGNPTSGVDPYEEPQYPVGTQPDRNYRGPAFDLGQNYSPDGTIEYKGNAFNGALNGKIMVVRYSGGDDILILTPDANGKIVQAQSGFAGLRGFVDPLDLTEDPNTGYIYVAEYGGQRLTLLKPIAPGANIDVNKTGLYFNDVQTASSGGAGSSPAQTVRITNNGTSALALPADGLTIVGANAGEFSFSGVALPATIQPGQFLDVPVKFTANAVGIRTATLQIKSNDPDQPIVNVSLRGLGTTGTGGDFEPSLQRILDLYQIPVNVGDNDPTTTAFPVPPVAGNDEVVMPRLVKAGAGNVTFDLLAVFDNFKTPAAKFGVYEPGTPDNKTQLFTVPDQNDAQSVNPQTSGRTSFDPASDAFSIYGVFPAFTNREVYSEDSLNTWEATAANRRKVRFYPLKNADGSVVPNAYVFAFEEYGVTYDQNDIVGIVRNVKPAPAGPEIGLANGDGNASSNVPGAPFYDRLVFNRIQNLDTRLPNVVHDKSVLTIRNTGSSALNITSLVLSDPTDFKIVGTPPTSIGAGSSANVTVQFVGVGTGLNQIFNATLTINSNDADEPSRNVALSGWWQSYSEQTPDNQYDEPSLKQVVQVFGYGTTILFPGEVMDTAGQPIKVGQETLSPYWWRADSNAPVTVRMIAALHKQSSQDVNGNLVSTASTIKWFYQGASTTLTTIFTHNNNEGQSFLPHLTNSTTSYAYGTFAPNSTTPFGFKIDSRYSDDALNPHTLDPGHAFRFFQARDEAGNIIPNTWIVAQDYTDLSYSNYDYQDNIYLVTNLRPNTPPTAPTGLVASGSGNGISLGWSANKEGNVVGYRVYRASSSSGPFTALNPVDLLTSPSYTDLLAPAGTSYYRVTAVDFNGGESPAATASATRSGTITVPAAASNLVASAPAFNTVNLTWTDNSNNETGFKIFRRVGGSGTFTLIFTTGANANSYSDTSVAASTTYNYQVVATNSAGDATASNTAPVTTPQQPAQGLLTSADIGNPTPAGSTNVITDGVDYDVTAGGANIWGTSDQFRFVYKQVTGDFDVKVDVISLQMNDPKSKAGIMARSSLAANSADAYARLNPTDANGPRLSYRLTDGGSSFTSGTGNGAAPRWARLQRVGNVFTAWFSTDGVNWTAQPSVTIAMPSTVFLGLATASDVAGGTTVAQYRGFGNTASQPPAAPADPSGLVATPANAGQVDLSWTDNSNNETGFKILRRTSGGTYAVVGSAAANAQTFSDTNNVQGSTDYFYEVVATNGGVDSNPSNEAAATTPASGPTLSFVGADVGAPAMPGNTSVVTPGSAFDVTGGGLNVWDAADQFHFAYKQVSGDFDLRARVAGATFASGQNPLLGLMARESLNADARNIYMRTYGAAGGANKLAYRTTTGGTTASVGGTNLNSYPNTWLRLTRVGNVFTGYASTDGNTWTTIGSITIALPSQIYIGLAVVSRSTTSTATAQFRDVSLG